MFCDFNKVFQSVIKRDKTLGMKIESYDTRNFYPNGISKRKQAFTSSELIDIYIKGNQDILVAMLESGFDDDLGLDIEERDWFNGLLNTRVNRSIFGEANRAVAELVLSYLDVPWSILNIGYWAFSNECVMDFMRLVNDFGKVSGNSSFSLYYEFFQKIECLRAFRYELSQIDPKSPVAAEEAAIDLQTLKTVRQDFEIMAKEIDNIEKNSESTRKRRNTSGEDQKSDVASKENT